MKYNQHDRVVYNGKKAKVITGWTSINGVPKYKIELRGGGTVQTTEDKLVTDDSDPWDLSDFKKQGTDTEAKCPRCGCEWKVTVFNAKKWYDCTYCKKTKKDIVKNHKDNGINPEPYLTDRLVGLK